MILKNCCQLIVDCEHRTAPTKTDGYPSIRTPNIGRGRFLLEGVNRVSKETFDAWTRRAVPKDDDLILAREAPIGNVAIIKNGQKFCLGQRTVLIRPDRSKVNPDYLMYLILSAKVQGEIQGKANGATVDHLNVKYLRNLELPDFPERNAQDKVAAILSAYDSLIQKNERRILILEQIAKLFYNEWFVLFKFPGHENVKMVDSELGEIPEIWKVKRLADILTELETGSRPKGGVGELVEGVPSIGAENIDGLGRYDFSKDKFVSEDYFRNLRRGIVRHKDVLLYKDGAGIGSKSMFRNKYPHEKCCVNEHVFILRTKDKFYQNFLYFWLDQNWMTEKIKNLNANAAQPGINQEGVRSLPILIPADDVLTVFDELVEPILDELFILAKKNRNLPITRDILLRKLISGDIDVSGFDIEVPEVES